MKNPLSAVVGICLGWVCFLQTIQAQESPVPMDDQYLGQTTPGDTPEIFAQSFFPDWIHTTPVFTRDLSVMYWSHDDKFLHVSYQNGEWDSGEIPLAKGDFDSPAISPDGKKLFYMARQPGIEGDASETENIWYSEKQGTQWSEPIPLGMNVNQHHMHWQISVANNGNLYFLTDYTGKSAIAVSDFRNGAYQVPRVPGSEINDDSQRQLGPFVAPDESYLLFSRAPDLQGSDELFISLNDGGKWSDAKKIRLKNGAAIRGICPIVSPDGKYLFFMAWTNRQHRVFWVSTREIEGLNADRNRED